MTRAVALLIAALLVFALLALTSHHKEPEERVEARATTTTTEWIETQPSLGEHFDQLVVAMKPKPRPRARAGVRVRTAGSVNGYPCGGELPPCYVLKRESNGNPTARNPRSTASGLWQFLDSTWAGFMGYARAYLAPPWVQNLKAKITWRNGAGCHHWSAC